MDDDKVKAGPPAVTPPFALLCAICLRHGSNNVAITSINGTALCTPHACSAPRAAIPYGDDD